MEQEKKKQNNELMTKGQLISFAYDVGFAIIIPLVILALGGKFLDQRMGTSPLFLITGILLSLVSTTIIIYKKIKPFL